MMISEEIVKTHEGNRKERLEHLIEVLEKVEDDELDMCEWFHSEPECGTTACAGGHACQDEAFQEMGLRYDESHESPLVEYEDEDGDRFWLFGYDALQYLFALTRKETCYLFDPLAYDAKSIDSKEEVISRIQDVIEKKDLSDKRVF